MAVFIVMIKEYEDKNKVVYQYGPNEIILGKIEFNKIHQKILDLQPVNDPQISNAFYFKRAAQRLAVLSVQNKEQFPERTTIES
ncbi:hypothetical protein [Flavobacterium sp. SORGH_AS_0622]|uniref:hypothetical protein n=1 Tax=Flavobacterium sp. SORGH_AS_0622 TaxID=3041772 RepID=UPI002787B825|nr:hypothetical protein [Flavobacterium sp. SORGH_AS_0622]MDQ1167143.1 hypothetical protein [Flavobacterium sp. SORGH_AS_0622]